MGDLIDRQDAIDALKKIMFTHLFENGEYIGEDTREVSIMNAEKALDVIENLPSAETEQKAKVMKHQYWLGVSLNVVGEQTIGYEWLCENCKKKVIDGDNYCSHCGARLEWE